VVLHTTLLQPREEEMRQASESALLWLRALRRLEQGQVHQGHLWWIRAAAADPRGPALPTMEALQEPAMCQVLRHYVSQCEEANRTRGRADFRAWLIEDLRTGGGAAHKVAGNKGAEAPETDAILEPRELNADLVLVTNLKAQAWAKIWSLPADRQAPPG
jgi:hypothetical protein